MDSTTGYWSLVTGHRAGIIACALLVIITAVVYFPIVHHDFINLDDNGYVYENPHVKQGLTTETVRWAFTTFTEANWHPLTWLSHALDVQLYGVEKPGMHHLTGLLFHILNVLLVFLVLTRMTGFVWRSAFVAALFAIHPTHVESVAWVAERKDVLSTFFWLLTMLAYVAYVKRPGVGRYLAVLAMFALGLMAKPMLVSLPIVLLIMDYWPLGRLICRGESCIRPGRSQGSPLQGAILDKLPLFAMTFASCIITFIAQKPTAVQSLETYSVGVRIANAIVAYARYLEKMVWPANLSVFYGHPGARLPTETVLGSALLLVCISAAVYAFGRKRQYLIAGWLWYVITLVPVIGLVQVGNQAMADRYTYVPLLGIFIAIAWAVPDLFVKSEKVVEIRKPKKGRAAPKQQEVAAQPAMRFDLAIPAILIVAVLMVITYHQVGYWKDTATLFAHTAKVSPGDAAAHIAVAQELKEKGQPEAAIEEYRKATELDSRNVDARLNLAALLMERGYDDEAAQTYNQLLAIQPGNAKAHSNIGHLLMKQRKWDDAQAHLETAIRLQPGYAQPYYNLGLALYTKAIMTGDSRLFPKSVEYYRKAIQLKPDYWEAHGNLAITLYSMGQYAEAWKEVRLSRQHGGTLNADFVKALTAAMPEPAFSDE